MRCWKLAMPLPVASFFYYARKSFFLWKVPELACHLSALSPSLRSRKPWLMYTTFAGHIQRSISTPDAIREPKRSRNLIASLCYSDVYSIHASMTPHPVCLRPHRPRSQVLCTRQLLPHTMTCKRRGFVYVGPSRNGKAFSYGPSSLVACALSVLTQMRSRIRGLRLVSVPRPRRPLRRSPPC